MFELQTKKSDFIQHSHLSHRVTFIQPIQTKMAQRAQKNDFSISTDVFFFFAFFVAIAKSALSNRAAIVHFGW